VAGGREAALAAIHTRLAAVGGVIAAGALRLRAQVASFIVLEVRTEFPAPVTDSVDFGADDMTVLVRLNRDPSVR
jgi:hypothetical protein